MPKAYLVKSLLSFLGVGFQKRLLLKFVYIFYRLLHSPTGIKLYSRHFVYSTGCLLIMVSYADFVSAWRPIETLCINHHRHSTLHYVLADSFLAYLLEVGVCDLQPVCVSVYPSQMFEFLNQSLKICMYVMAAEPILVMYFRKSPSSGCVTDTFPWQRIHATVEELLGASFLCTARANLWVCLYNPLAFAR
jgi:hypothetical protein